MYLHIYYDPVKALEDERRFTKKIIQLHNELTSGNHDKNNESEYNMYFDTTITPDGTVCFAAKDAVLEDAKKNSGVFVLVGNDALNTKQALITYRRKDVVEKAFDNVKDRLDMRRLNVSSDLSLDGKLFVEFIALIYISFLHNAMSRKDLYKKFTMYELLDELEMIERYDRQGFKPQISEITVKQSEIFSVLGFVPPKSSLC
jgi:transposase